MTRAISPALGTVLLALIAVALAGVLTTTVGTAALPTAEPEFVAMTATATADGEITLTHDGGEPIDVREIDVRVRVDGTGLTEQPPVPFFSTSGFEPGPTGPFNSAADPRWTAGEQASFVVAGTNEPTLDPGEEVVVELRRDDRPVARARTTVPGG